MADNSVKKSKNAPEGSGALNEGMRRVLTTKDLIVYGIVFMIPVAPFAWYGSYLQTSQGMVALGYTVAFVGMLFTGFAYASMANRYPVGGSVYRYVQQSVSPALGFISGWGLMLSYFILPAVTYCVGAMFMATMTPNVPAWAWIVILAVITTLINWLGVKTMSMTSWILFAVQMLCIVWFMIGTIVMVINGHANFNTVAFYNASNFSTSAVLSATIIVIISYVGFDAISTLSSETKDPKTMIGKATIGTIIGAGGLFILMTWFAGVAYPNWQDLNTDTAFLQILAVVGGKPLVLVSTIVIVISFGLASGSECMTAATRIMYSMSRDGIYPAVFKKLNKHQVPGVAIIFVGILNIVLGIWIGLNTLAVFAAFGNLIAFMTLNLSVVWRFYIKAENKTGTMFFKYVISPLLGFSICFYIFAHNSSLTWVVGITWMIIGVIWLAVVTKGFKKPTPTLDMG